MKKIILNIALVSLVFAGFTSCKEKNTDTAEVEETAQATEMASDYIVNTGNSKIMWGGSKPTGSHHGTVMISSGTLSVNNDTIEAGNFVIDMTSITDEDLEGDKKQNLENHLKGTVEGKEGDFFNVTKYPTATFELTGVADVEGKKMVRGNLTIKDKTNAVEFPATIKIDGNNMMLASEPFIIDRTKWDVNYGSKSVFDNLGDKFISDDMEITISLSATKS